MKIVHTSDWHVGRRWKGIMRLDEMEAVLDHLAAFIETESVDLVLHSGDVFDGRNPPAEAERLVNRFFVRVGRAGAQMVVIAGNHDDAGRLDARSLLAEFTNVTIVGRPRRADKGGTRTIETANGEKAIVAALPFASAGTWVSALDLAEDDSSARIKYARMFQLAVKNLCSAYRSDSVNLLMAHTHLEGAVFGESERRVHIGNEWAATPQTLPTDASYIALGHIHKPQRVEGTLPAYYAGSPLQLDFSEVGQDKSFIVVDARPGQPSTVERIPYEGGVPLVDIISTLAQLEENVDAYLKAGWLRVTVPLQELDPDINRKVRDLLPNALVVRAEVPEVDEHVAIRLDDQASPVDHYSEFHRREHGQDAPSDVRATFQRLYEEAAKED